MLVALLVSGLVSLVVRNVAYTRAMLVVASIMVVVGMMIYRYYGDNTIGINNMTLVGVLIYITFCLLMLLAHTTRFGDHE
jgi:cyanate permease